MIRSSPACSRKNKIFATKNKGNKTKYSQYKQNEVHADYINVHLPGAKKFSRL
jgi:beta-galactosidase beta subunit